MEEVKQVVFKMGGDKALGLDGFPALFLSTILGHCGSGTMASGGRSESKS